MCRFIETIRIEKREPCRIQMHNDRANKARAELLGATGAIDLSEYIDAANLQLRARYRCRVTFAQEVEQIIIERYSQRLTNSLQLVDGGSLNYQYKFEDRSAIDNLYVKRGVCDDILIVRDDLVTDTSYANIAFFDGVQWITPAQPLLEGTMRRHLIESGICVPGNVSLNELIEFEGWTIFNAMIDFDPHAIRPIDAIKGFH